MPQRSYKFRVYPTATQVARLNIEFGHARWVWNCGLRFRSEWYSRFGDSVTSTDFSRELTFLKTLEPYAWLKDASSTVLTQKLRDLDTAFRNFFAQRAKYPRYRKKHHAQSVRFQMDQRIVASNFRAGSLLKLPRLGELKVKWSRLPTGIPKMVTLSRDAVGRYFVSMMVDETIQPLPAKTNSVGIDLGIKDVVVGSNGFRSGNPKHLAASLKQLRHAQRVLSRRKKGSHRWRAARVRVARLHSIIRNQRMDFLHKLTTALVRENQVIAREDLHVKGLLRNRRIARALGDAGLGELRRQLDYKAQWYGRKILEVDRFAPTSKTCSACGHVLKSLPLSVRDWTCPDCGADHDRDQNAAQNVLSFATGGSPGRYARGGVKTPETIAA